MNDNGGYVVASDVGGTCTDTIVFAAGEPLHLGKALSTPPHFADGVLDSIANAADGMGIGREELFARTTMFVHGSTVVDNALLTREGAKVGLVTTEGFEDTLLATRGAYGRWAGLTEDRIKHPVKTDRAPPLVAPDCIAGVPRASRLQGRRAEAARRGSDRGGAAAPARGQGRYRDGGVLPVVILQPRPRAPGRRHPGPRLARNLCQPVERHRPGAGRVRTHLDHGHQRLCRAHHQRLSRQPAEPAHRQRLPRPDPGHAGLWRPAAGQRGG